MSTDYCLGRLFFLPIRYTRNVPAAIVAALGGEASATFGAATLSLTAASFTAGTDTFATDGAASAVATSLGDNVLSLPPIAFPIASPDNHGTVAFVAAPVLGSAACALATAGDETVSLAFTAAASLGEDNIVSLLAFRAFSMAAPLRASTDPLTGADAVTEALERGATSAEGKFRAEGY